MARSGRLLVSLVLSVALSAPAVAHAARWAPAVDLVSSSQPIFSPSLAGRPDGTLIMSWLAGPGAGADLMAATRPPGGAWGAPEKISGGAAVQGGHLETDAAGGAVAVWLENGYVRGATLPPGGAWQIVPVPLSGSGAGAPAMATAPDGTTAVAWIESSVIKVSVRAPGGAFSAASTITSGTGPKDLFLAAGPSSDMVLCWDDTSGASTRLMSAYRGAGGPAFQAAQTVASASPNVGDNLYYVSTTVAFNGTGEASVVWMSILMNNGANQTTNRWQAKWRGAGSAGTWGPQFPEVLDSRTVNNTLPQTSSLPAVAADAGGRTTAAWKSLNTTEVFTSVRPDGAANGFGTPQAIGSTTSPVLALRPVGPGLLLLDSRAQAGTFALSDGSFGPFDGTPFPPAATPTGMAATGDAAGDAAVAWSVLDGSTFRLRWAPYDVTAPEAQSLSIPTTAVAGAAATFSVTPYDALSGATAAWDFGDGTTASGATVTHSYAAAANRTATVTVTDGAGNTATASGPVSVTTAPAPGGGAGADASPGPRALADTRAPVLSAVAIAARRFRVAPGRTALAARARTPRGTRVSWRLSEAGTIRFVLTRVPRGGKAVAAGRLARRAKAGAGKLAFSGRLGRKALRRGSYRMTLTATDAAGNASRPVALRFTIV
jgi:PKD domain